eukprot:1127605-Pyramimonas_sp.AAC.1
MTRALDTYFTASPDEVGNGERDISSDGYMERRWVKEDGGVRARLDPPQAASSLFMSYTPKREVHHVGEGAARARG